MAWGELMDVLCWLSAEFRGVHAGALWLGVTAEPGLEKAPCLPQFLSPQAPCPPAWGGRRAAPWGWHWASQVREGPTSSIAEPNVKPSGPKGTRPNKGFPPFAQQRAQPAPSDLGGTQDQRGRLQTGWALSMGLSGLSP